MDLRSMIVFAAALALGGLPGAVRADDATDTPPAPTDDAGGATAAFRAAHGKFVEGARRFTPMVELRALGATGGKVKSESGKFDLTMLSFDAAVPIPISKDAFVIAGGFTHSRRYRFERKALGTNDDTLYGAGLRLGLGGFVSDDLLLQAIWQPSIFSDLDGTLHHEDWYLWYGMALATYRASDTLYLKGGIALTDAFRDSGVLPLVGFSWLYAEGWRLDVLIPRNIEVAYTAAPPWILHGGFEWEGEEYRMRSHNSGVERSAGVHAVDLRLFLGAIFRATEHVSISAKAGLLVGGTYDWRDGTGFDYDGPLERGGFGSIGVGWTF